MRHKTQQGDGAPRPGQTARRAIDAACQKGDTQAAFAAFDAAMADDDPLQPHSCNVLLHLCSGGVTGGNYDGGGGADAAAQAAKVVVPRRDAVHPERANAIFNYMMANDVPRTEMTYTVRGGFTGGGSQKRRLDHLSVFFFWRGGVGERGTDPKVKTASIQATSFLQKSGAAIRNEAKLYDSRPLVAPRLTPRDVSD